MIWNLFYMFSFNFHNSYDDFAKLFKSLHRFIQQYLFNWTNHYIWYLLLFSPLTLAYQFQYPHILSPSTHLEKFTHQNHLPTKTHGKSFETGDWVKADLVCAFLKETLVAWPRGQQHCRSWVKESFLRPTGPMKYHWVVYKEISWSLDKTLYKH